MPCITHRARLKAVLLAALLAAAAPAQPQAQAPALTLGFDLLKVLNAAYYPIQIMAYCYKEVSQNKDFQNAALDWNRRNSDLMAKLETMAKQQRISNDLRVQSDKETLAAIEKVVGSQFDKIAYCKLIRSLVDGGQYDLVIRQDLTEPLRRIFPSP